MLAVIHGEVAGAKSPGELAIWLGGIALIVLIVKFSDLRDWLRGFLDILANPYTDDYRASPLTDQPLDPQVETSEAGNE